ncbi:MAG: NapH/MauN family ferredoxin-type protein [Deltaproteobacteria bacterium]|jgi:ferredoxin-type protein NapH|nr:NapH/MauN family ferredoxin-type protein [Deltaproteobacteria bacterium]MBW2503069.1 NapH/MauN family ferredoxin-type protein [Deltaproteobacteria bacterium]MBW2521053.1 NapH/MauN family ferredoxin-type protein [Deltaproteobacteria bacterium]
MKVNRWTVWRRIVQILVLLLLATPSFGLSFFEGNLGAAAILGLQLSDPLAALQILILTGSLTLTMLSGTGIILLFYGILGGRVFCGWVCPVHFMTDLTDMFPWTKRLTFWRLEWKYIALAITGILSFALGVPAFETFSPIGIAGRALTFGASSSLIVLVLIIIIELILVRRIWCRCLCPLGGFYTLLGHLSPLSVAYDQAKCTNCGECQRVCFVPEVLEPTLNKQVDRVHSGECTRCGACIGICPDHALNFGIRKPF